MIRIVHFLRRKQHLTLAEFHDRLRDDHGSRVAALQSDLRFTRHVQTHRLEDAFAERIATSRDGLEAPFDGVAETWWLSEEAMVQAARTGAGGRAAANLRAAAADLVDFANSPCWVAREYPFHNRSSERVVARATSGIVKLQFVIRPRAGMNVGDGQRYWRTAHGPVGEASAPLLGLMNYQQVHKIESSADAWLRESGSTFMEPYMGHAEMWIDLRDIRTGAEADAARRLAVEDERRFIDFSRSNLWVGEEHIIFDSS